MKVQLSELIEDLVHQRQSKANTKCCLSLHHKPNNSYLLVNGKTIFKFKADTKNVNFHTQFFLGSISNGFSATESREISLKWKCV